MNDMCNRELAKKWYIIGFFCLLSPIVYCVLSQYFRGLKINLSIEGADNYIILANSLVAVKEVLGAVSAAIMLAAPLAWIVRTRAYVVALFLSASTALFTLLPNILMDIKISDFSLSFREISVELIFYLSCWVVAAATNSLRNYGSRRSENYHL